MTDLQETSPSEPLPIWYWLFMLTGAAMIVMVTLGIQQKSGKNAWWLGMLVLLAYTSLSGIVWRVADWLRIAAMPSAYLSAGFFDTLRLQVFWAVGPQFFGLLFLTLAGVFAVVHWGSPPKASRAAAMPASAAPASMRSIAPAASPSSSSESTPSHVAESGTDTTSPTAPPSQSGASQLRCDDPTVLALVHREVWAAAAMRIKSTHGVDLSVEQLAPILELGLQNIREGESNSPTYTLCIATFDQHAHIEARQLGLETLYASDLAYWIELDASGNLQVGVGD